MSRSRSRTSHSSFRTAWRTAPLIAGLAIASAVGCEAADTAKAECQGEEGCACYGNGTCDDDLSCLSNYCVDPTGSADDDAGKAPSGDDDNSPSDDDATADDDDAPADDDDAPADDDAEPAASSDDDVTADDDAADDPVSEPAADDDAPADDDTVADDDTQAEPSADDDVPADDDLVADDDVSADDDENSDDDSSSCMGSGMCATGDGVDCVDGAPVERECAGCALLSCGVECCSGLSTLGAIVYPDFIAYPELVDELLQTETEATLYMDFTDEFQMGAILFGLDKAYTIDPADVIIQLKAEGSGLSGAVTVSLEDGDAGCQYQAGLYDSTVDWDYVELSSIATTCWGDADELSPVRQINVRIDAESSGSARLTVAGIEW